MKKNEISAKTGNISNSRDSKKNNNLFNIDKEENTNENFSDFSNKKSKKSDLNISEGQKKISSKKRNKIISRMNINHIIMHNKFSNINLLHDIKEINYKIHFPKEAKRNKSIDFQQNNLCLNNIINPQLKKKLTFNNFNNFFSKNFESFNILSQESLKLIKIKEEDKKKAKQSSIKDSNQSNYNNSSNDVSSVCVSDTDSVVVKKDSKKKKAEKSKFCSEKSLASINDLEDHLLSKVNTKIYNDLKLSFPNKETDIKKNNIDDNYYDEKPFPNSSKKNVTTSLSKNKVTFSLDINNSNVSDNLKHRTSTKFKSSLKRSSEDVNLLNSQFSKMRFSSNYEIPVIAENILENEGTSKNINKKIIYKEEQIQIENINDNKNTNSYDNNQNNNLMCILQSSYEKLLEKFRKSYKHNFIDFYTCAKKPEIPESSELQDQENEEFSEEQDLADEAYENYVISNLKVIKKLSNLFNSEIYYQKVEETRERIKAEALDRESNRLNNYTIGEAKFDYTKDILIFDLDETLIHSEPLKENEKINTSDKLFTLESLNIKVYVRPGVLELLSYAKENFNLILMSAGIGEYCSAVLDYLKLKNYFCYIIPREYCIKIDDVYIKDIDIFRKTLYQNYEELIDIGTKECIIIDNNIYSFAMNLTQGVLISSFFTDLQEDNDLFDLIDYLKELVNEKVDELVLMSHKNESHFYFETLMLNLEDEDEEEENEYESYNNEEN